MRAKRKAARLSSRICRCGSCTRRSRPRAGGPGLRQLRWHDLRHSFASQLASRGVPLRRIQEWLGHSTIHVTMRYAHLAPSGDPGLLANLDATYVPEAGMAERKSG